MLENNSISHHTSSYTTLCRIIKGQCFKVQYCSEKIYVSRHKSMHIAVPMVSFADIRPSDYVKSFWRPKNEDSTRLGYYGDYAIGMTKDWANSHNVYPILYFPKPKNDTDTLPTNSLLYPLVGKAHKKLNPTWKGRPISDCPSIAAFCKHYIGPLEKNEEESGRVNSTQYSFHLEQEWRYVPNDLRILWNFYNSRNDHDFNDSKNAKKNKNREIAQVLTFDLWSDVSFIVVKSHKFAMKLKDVINSLFEGLDEGKKNDLKERLDFLCTNIITTEQLINNY